MLGLITLSLLVVSELSIQEGKEEEFLRLVTDGLEVSRNFQGNQRFDIYAESETPGKILFIEEWTSAEDFQRYYRWRLGNGDFATLSTYFSAPPRMRKYDTAAEEE
ncbi:MAG: putative quinol monooxygenase [Pseudohongiellaceae bacterium]